MMISFRNAAATSAAVLFLLTFSPSQADAQATPAIAQQLPQPLREDRYVADFAAMLDEWNQSKLGLPSRAALRPLLEQRTSETVKLKIYPYEIESWQNGILKNFDDLPAQLKPEKRLDTSSEMMLLLLFLKGRDQFEKQVKREDLRKELNLPLFLILGSAQETAKKSALPTIDPSTIARSLLSWWTAVWPFCK